MVVVTTRDGADYHFDRAVKSAKMDGDVITIVNVYNITSKFYPESKFSAMLDLTCLGGLLNDKDFKALAKHFYLGGYR